MERLTKLDAYGNVDCALQTVCQHEENCCDCGLIAKKLAKYEDAEEHELLVMLPCKVGDTVYNIIPSRKIISTLKVKVVLVYENEYFFEWELIDGIYDNLRGFGDWEIGKTVFLTRREAEAALSEVPTDD